MTLSGLPGFAGRSCLVTGAGNPTGIGFVTARLFGTLGADVAIVSTTDRIHARAEELQALGVKAQGYVADLSKPDQVQRMVESVVRDFGRIDVLVNNAGMTQVGSAEKFVPFVDISFAEWHATMERNLSTCVYVTRFLLPHMVQNRYGRIVNVSSVTGPLVSSPGESAYSAAKAGMVGMSRAIALEVADNNIVINNVAPGWIDTGSLNEMEIIAGRSTPMGRLGRSDEVAHLIAFLASETASYITGQLFVVDGGNSIQEYKRSGEHLG